MLAQFVPHYFDFCRIRGNSRGYLPGARGNPGVRHRPGGFVCGPRDNADPRSLDFLADQPVFFPV